jgi:hypothetical protein
MIKTKYNWHQTGKMAWYDGSTFETIFTNFPVTFKDDFLGYKLDKYVANENTSAKWHTLVTSGATAPALVANDPNGVVQVTLDATDEAEQQALYWGDQLSLKPTQGLIFEARVAFKVLPTTGTETTRAAFGLASGNNATLDNVATNAWFRVESGAQTALLFESDDGTTDDDDNAAGVTLVAEVYHVYRIDMTDITAVKFYVDGVLVGTTSMAALTSAVVQPLFTVQKAKSSANTGTGTLYIDYVEIWQNRA